MRASGALVSLLGLGLVLPACGRLEPLRGCEGEGGVEVLCGFQNPEDLAAAPGGEWIVVSQFPRLVDGETAGSGSLLVLRPSDGERRVLFPVPGAPVPAGVAGAGGPECGGPPDPGRFSPHGIDVKLEPDGGARLLVVNHGGREAIELFRLVVGAEGPSASWEGCVSLPDDAQANDVAALPEGRFVTTKMLPRRTGLLSMLRIALGLVTGELLEWGPGEGWHAVPDSQGSAPNGVIASADGRTLYFAAWGTSTLVRVGRDGSGRRELPLPHHPDNLTWGADGRLLVTGQKASITDIPACGQIDSGTCPLPFSVLRVDPEQLTFEVAFDHDPARLSGGGTVALEQADALWIGTFAGDRVLRVAEAR
jgi:sugar lactone lactonase YvrE